MKTSLTKGLEPEIAQKVEIEYKSCVVYRRRMKELLTKEKELLVEKMVYADTSSPNWANEQAILIAQIKANEKFFALL